MKVCRLQIEVFMFGSMIMIVVKITNMTIVTMRVSVIMIALMSEYESTDNIDKKSYDSNDKCYVIVDSKWWYQSLHWKDTYKQTHNTE